MMNNNEESALEHKQWIAKLTSFLVENDDLWGRCLGLDDRRFAILKAKLVQGKTYAAIAKEYNISANRVGILFRGAFRKVRYRPHIWDEESRAQFEQKKSAEFRRVYKALYLQEVLTVIANVKYSEILRKSPPIPISVLNLNNRIRSALERDGKFKTVRDLYLASKAELSKVHGLGLSGLKDIEQALKKHIEALGRK